MKRNTYFIIVAVIAFLELYLLWWALNYSRPPAMEITGIGIAAGIITALILKGKVEDASIGGDERLHLINEKSAMKTLQITWILLFSFSVSALVIIVERGDIFRRHFLGFPFIQMIILFTAILIFVACRIYYSNKYGGYISDEE
ncbi:DUF2178 domain-containing protein [Methanoplanus sp. FWC-SCC4]|uniref:DUF2178 domain-containing protein n=1 Tax=Methanochimaera problematica TaxID=2609417 RepID=A0AA97I4E4_9EURY|nr:DUF2178 domain-containing protein [Methanoplanus sp. FWC-SCC4]WOF16856.1 DUF2178 domain-containing protein [Methanoplanus sp. FWC-SCC4]